MTNESEDEYECSDCGARIERGDTFCKKCGAKLEWQSEPDSEESESESEHENREAPQSNSWFPSTSWRQSIVTDPQAPELYSRRVIYFFSVGFSPIFGAILLSINIKRIDRTRDIIAPISYAVAALAFMVYLIVRFDQQLDELTFVPLLLNVLTALPLSNYFWNRGVGEGVRYRARSFGVPLLIGLVIVGVTVWARVQNNTEVNQQSTSSYQSSDDNTQTESNEVNQTFNTSDESVRSNGNVAVAAQRILSSTPSLTWRNAKSVSSAQISKDPFRYIGQLVRITGTVYSVKTLPPSQGSWVESLLLSENPNSALGVISVDYLYNGSADRINSQTVITCAGYFAGTEQSKNAYGGDVEVLVLVGNAINGH